MLIVSVLAVAFAGKFGKEIDVKLGIMNAKQIIFDGKVKGESDLWTKMQEEEEKDKNVVF